jgi:hypothetical protein
LPISRWASLHCKQGELKGVKQLYFYRCPFRLRKIFMAFDTSLAVSEALSYLLTEGDDIHSGRWKGYVWRAVLLRVVSSLCLFFTARACVHADAQTQFEKLASTLQRPHAGSAFAN